MYTHKRHLKARTLKDSTFIPQKALYTHDTTLNQLPTSWFFIALVRFTILKNCTEIKTKLFSKNMSVNPLLITYIVREQHTQKCVKKSSQCPNVETVQSRQNEGTHNPTT